MFLTGERLGKVEELFSDETGSGKHYIPLGVNVLKFKSVTKLYSPGLMYGFEFYKAPQHRSNRATKVSYHPIFCYHEVGEGDDNWKNMWYRPETNTMSEQQIKRVSRFKGSDLKALVRQRVLFFRDEHGNQIYGRNGAPVYFVECEIDRVYKTDEEVVLYNEEYFDLLEYGEKRQV